MQEREGSRDSKMCHFRKGLYSLFTTISPFYELAPLQLLFKYVYCVSLCVCVCESVRVYQGQTECVFFSLMRVDTVSRGNLFTNAQRFLYFPFALGSVRSTWKSVCCAIVQTASSQSVVLCLCLLHE